MFRSRLFLALVLAAPATFFACTPTVGEKPIDEIPEGELVDGMGNDADRDGYGEAIDCDDADATINPGATEMCSDAIDNDCDDLVDDADPNAARGAFCFDGDGDGFCQDWNDDGEVDVVSLCDNSDLTAETVAGQTGGDPDAVQYYIEVVYGPLPNYDLPPVDCDDESAGVNPDAEEVCDLWSVDEDCDGFANSEDPDDWVSEPGEWFADMDLDGYGDPAVSEMACDQPQDYVADNTDCDDDNAGVNPGAQEVCDASDVDEDCDGMADDADASASGQSVWYQDSDADGYGDASMSAMACDSMAGYVADATDCNDADASYNPGAVESCANDGEDNDCDGDANENPADETVWYFDGDGDGYGDATISFQSCVAPSGYVEDDTDCDDSDADINPGAGDGFNGIDDDCDGDIDEGPCLTEIQILSANGDPTLVTGMVMSDPSMDGEWYPTAMLGVDVMVTDLGGLEREIFISLGVCLDMSVVADVWFEDGTSLADDADAEVWGWEDGVPLNVGFYDNGDGTFGLEFAR